MKETPQSRHCHHYHCCLRDVDFIARRVVYWMIAKKPKRKEWHQQCASPFNRCVQAVEYSTVVSEFESSEGGLKKASFFSSFVDTLNFKPPRVIVWTRTVTCQSSATLPYKPRWRTILRYWDITCVVRFGTSRNLTTRHRKMGTCLLAWLIWRASSKLFCNFMASHFLNGGNDGWERRSHGRVWKQLLRSEIPLPAKPNEL